MTELYATKKEIEEQQASIKDLKTVTEHQIKDLVDRITMLEKMLFNSDKTITIPSKPLVAQPKPIEMPTTNAVPSVATPSASVAKTVNMSSQIKELVNTNNEEYFKWYAANIDPSFVVATWSGIEKLKIINNMEKKMSLSSNKVKWQEFISAQEI